MSTRVLNLDAIASMSDDELFGRLHSTRNYINRIRSERGNSVNAEVDFCYLVREVEIREARRSAHQRWLSSRRNFRRR